MTTVLFLLVFSSTFTTALPGALPQRVAAAGFPDFPQPGSPVLKNLRLRINVIFMGIPESLIDTSVILRELPETYAQIDRSKDMAVQRLIKYSEYTLEYRFEFAPSIFADKYAKFIDDNHYTDSAPWWLQEQGVKTVGFVSGRDAELWIKENMLGLMEKSGYTVIIVDTWHTSQRVKYYYFYDHGIPDIDTGRNANPECNAFESAFGGYYRFLVLDLAAGPTNYRDTNTVKLIIDYKEPKEFSVDIGKYVRNTIEFRFIPSYLYAPIYRPSVFVNVTIYSKDPSIRYSDILKMDRVLREYRDLQPYSNFTGAIREIPIHDDRALFRVVEALTDVNGITNPDPDLFNYFTSNYRKYAGPHGKDYVVPVIVMGGYDFGGLLGIAQNLPDGSFGFVLCCINPVMLGVRPVMVPLYSARGGLPAGGDVHGFVLMNPEMEMIFSCDMQSGTVMVVVLDAYNWWKFGKTRDIQQIEFKKLETWEKGHHEMKFTPTDKAGKYFVMIFNSRSNENAVFSGQLITTKRFSYGLSSLVVHEAGHSFCLPHPHDGFSWKLYQEGLPIQMPGEYGFWLWDYSNTPMTYAQPSMRFDQLDRDIMNRGLTTTVLNDTFTLLKAMRSDLERKGFKEMPSSAMEQVNSALKSVDQSMQLFSQPSPDYFGALKEALNAKASAEKAYLTATQEGAAFPLTAQTALVVVSAALIAVVVLYVAVRRKKKTTPTVALSTPPPQTSTKYCITCGRTIPLKADICEHCGAKQS